MKTSEFKKELEKSETAQLHEKLDALRRDLFSLKLNESTTHIKDYSQFKKIKANIARILTSIRAKETR